MASDSGTMNPGMSAAKVIGLLLVLATVPACGSSGESASSQAAVAQYMEAASADAQALRLANEKVIGACSTTPFACETVRSNQLTSLKAIRAAARARTVPTC